ncbi:molybdenum cofactor guanylyltransferase [Zafaria sp. Z1313]|uniref:molybdenum cofactor guanylyltransferase n=1 Tax=unclassified Zafaria TaxID=2828765 RepID=UPI002E79D35C|nr:NTP transferase domain-containing protein [Zafaria sp. J156]MEE1622254.1 NTP transferase domain-containing protein [Zafaria sp. J156]
MSYGAIVLAGGRGSRLGGAEKPLLVHAGRTLLEHALAAVSGAERVAVVGPAGLKGVVSAYVEESGVDQLVVLTREHPPYAGPAAAVAAGLRALQEAPGVYGEEPRAEAASAAAAHAGMPPFVVVLAADLVEPGPAVAAVVRAAGEALRDGPGAGAAWVPVDAGGRLQTLSCSVATGALAAAVEAAEASAGGLADSSMMRLLASLQLVRLPLEDLVFDDVDTWADAGRAGIGRPGS